MSIFAELDTLTSDTSLYIYREILNLLTAWPAVLGAGIPVLAVKPKDEQVEIRVKGDTRRSEYPAGHREKEKRDEGGNAEHSDCDTLS